MNLNVYAMKDKIYNNKTFNTEVKKNTNGIQRVECVCFV